MFFLRLELNGILYFLFNNQSIIINNIKSVRKKNRDENFFDRFISSLHTKILVLNIFNSNNLERISPRLFEDTTRPIEIGSILDDSTIPNMKLEIHGSVQFLTYTTC